MRVFLNRLGMLSFVGSDAWIEESYDSDVEEGESIGVSECLLIGQVHETCLLEKVSVNSYRRLENGYSYFKFKGIIMYE